MARGGKRVYRRDYKEKRDDKWQQDVPEGETSKPKRDTFLKREDMNCPDFEEYYKAQEVVPEGEWDEFMTCLRKPLPVTFRINGGGRFASALRDKLQSDFFSHMGTEPIMVDGEPMCPPRPLPWYPNQLAWHMSFTRGQLRKMPMLNQVHEYLKHANDHGSISRQEAVSMVPPLFMDVHAHHKILDMCAAPGSKTFQLLEALHTGGPDSRGGGVPAGEVPTGFVIANDADFKRCSLLTHQLKRVCSPCLVVTNHSAEQFPVLSDGKARLRFDRILCDVPCSGDGTMRKAPDIWSRWTPNNGNALHGLQIRIALQGCRLLAVGGLMVYSTCTFNPVEDEAVVSEVLLRCAGAVELLDVSDRLPELKRLPGQTHWRVCERPKQGDPSLRWYQSYDECKDERASRLERSMFPSEAKAALPLHRCMRFLPHHQDTGGFFVAVLRKIAEVPASASLKPRQEKEQGLTEQRAAAGTAESLDPAGGAITNDPLTAAREAAAAAAAAVERGLEALEAHDPFQASTAAGEANRAAAQALRAQARADAVRAAEQAAAAGAIDPDAPAAAGSSAGADGLGSAAGPSSAGPRAEAMDVEQPTAGSTPEEAAAATAAELAATKKQTGYSWIRGNGGRNRPGAKERKGYHLGVDPLAPVEDPEVLNSITEFYGLPASLPLSQQLITRSLESSRPKRLHYVSRSILDLLLMDKDEQLKIPATGLKILDRQDDKEGSGCNYRVAMEGLPFLMPHITRQRVTVPVAVMLQLVTQRTLDFPPPPPAVNATEALAMPPPGADAAVAAAADGAAGTSAPGPTSAAPAATRPPGYKDRVVLQDAAVVAKLREQRVGCCIIELDQKEAEGMGLATPAGEARNGDDGSGGGALMAGAPLAVVAWRGRASVSIMVEKSYSEHMIDRLETALKEAAASAADATLAPVLAAHVPLVSADASAPADVLE